MNAADNELQRMLEELDPLSRTLVAEVDLGLEARDFLASRLGQHFVGCAQQEIAEAQLALATVMPWRRRKIQELQNRVWRANFLLSWLRDLLVSGKSAADALDEEERGE